MFNNVFIIEEFENVQTYKKKIKIKFINFQTSIDSFYRFFFGEVDERERWQLEIEKSIFKF